MPDQNIYSLTLVLPKADKKLLTHAADLCAQIDSLDVTGSDVLSSGVALDLAVKSANAATVRPVLEGVFDSNDVQIDFCLQKASDRKKQLLICDMDSTLIGQECIDELADFAGVKGRVSEITERAMRGELDFEQALIERVNLLKNLPLSNLQDCFDQRIRLNAGAKTLAATMSKNGAQTVIVSGGFTFFTSRIAELAGFAHNQANTLIDNGESLTGEVGFPILGRDAKKSALDEFSADLGGAETAIAIGDGANDLAMIQAAGLGIAYYAKPIVASAAHCAINHTDLETALYFQGYKETEFVKTSD